MTFDVSSFLGIDPYRVPTAGIDCEILPDSKIARVIIGDIIRVSIKRNGAYVLEGSGDKLFDETLSERALSEELKEIAQIHVVEINALRRIRTRGNDTYLVRAFLKRGEVPSSDRMITPTNREDVGIMLFSPKEAYFRFYSLVSHNFITVLAKDLKSVRLLHLNH